MQLAPAPIKLHRRDQGAFAHEPPSVRLRWRSPPPSTTTRCSRGGQVVQAGPPARAPDRPPGSSAAAAGPQLLPAGRRPSGEHPMAAPWKVPRWAAPPHRSAARRTARSLLPHVPQELSQQQQQQQQYQRAVPQYQPYTPQQPAPSFWSQVPPLVWIGVGARPQQGRGQLPARPWAGCPAALGARLQCYGRGLRWLLPVRSTAARPTTRPLVCGRRRAGCQLPGEGS
jgi:hypothetical protein